MKVLLRGGPFNGRIVEVKVKKTPGRIAWLSAGAGNNSKICYKNDGYSEEGQKVFRYEVK